MAAPVLALLLGIGGGDATRVTDWRGALELPLSPASVAMLMGHAEEARVRERWAEALSHADPEVRATAARAIAAAGVIGLGDVLRAALARETDADAAVELIRSAVALGAVSPGDPALGSALERHAAAAGATADALAWSLGPDLLADPRRLAGVERAMRDRLFRIAARGEEGGFTRLASYALRSSDASLWDDVLASARASGIDPADEVLAAALRSESSEVRALTSFHLAARGRGLSPNLTRVVGEAPEQALPPSPDEAFALALLRRAEGQAPVTDAAWVARAAGDAVLVLPSDFARRPGFLRLLTGPERSVVVARLAGELLQTTKDGTAVPPEQVLEERALQKVEVTRPPTPTSPRPRLASGLPGGLIGDLLRVTGCKPSADAPAAAQVTYRRDGRPRQVALIDTHLSPACEAAARAAIPLVRASDPTAWEPERAEVVFLRLETEESCEAPGIASKPPRGVGTGRITEPKKTRNVAPIYPMPARQARIQGLVIMEAVINEAGCIRELTVLRGIPALDWAALDAVSRWRYTPTLLDGRPVPVIMTVSVNFKLN